MRPCISHENSPKSRSLSFAGLPEKNNDFAPLLGHQSRPRPEHADLARRHGVSEATIYNWKSKYGGLEVSDARRLKELESENAKLKRLLADAMLDKAALKDLLAKKF